MIIHNPRNIPCNNSNWHSCSVWLNANHYSSSQTLHFFLYTHNRLLRVLLSETYISIWRNYIHYYLNFCLNVYRSIQWNNRGRRKLTLIIFITCKLLWLFLTIGTCFLGLFKTMFDLKDAANMCNGFCMQDMYQLFGGRNFNVCSV